MDIHKTLFVNRENLACRGWYWCAVSCARELEYLIKMHQEYKKIGAPKEAVDIVMDWCVEVAHICSFACTQHDILLRKEDPCSDCEPLRRQTDIANALQGYYDLHESLNYGKE